MIQRPTRQIVSGTALFLMCELGLLFLRLLPLSGGYSGWPGPDLGLCLLMAWLLRRPDQLAAPVIAGFYMLEDVMLLRPLGLWAALVLLGTEAARSREYRWRDQPFMIEWLRVSMLIGTMMLANRLILMLALLPVASLGQVILHYLATVASYPAVVLAARWLIGLRRISPTEAEMSRRSR